MSTETDDGPLRFQGAAGPPQGALTPSGGGPGAARPWGRLRAVPQRQSLVDDVVDQLAEPIRAGAVRPGSRLPAEHELSQRFAVSRTVVREAVARLKAEGLVATQRGQGLFVAERGPGEGMLRLRAPAAPASDVARELLEFRAGLETEAAGHAAIRRTPQDVDALVRALDRLVESDGRGGNGGVEDFAFHLAIARASRNTYILQVLEFLSPSIAGAITQGRAQQRRRAGFIAAAHREHRRLLDAIRAGDPAEARRAMRDHLDAGMARLLAVLPGEPASDPSDDPAAATAGLDRPAFP